MGDGEPNLASPLSRQTLERLQQRSDARGLVRLAGHLAIMGGTGYLTKVALERGSWLSALFAMSALGFTFATMFAAMHESVHRTAFRSQLLNDSVGWFAGLLSFYNSTFYRPYHGWHHRFTQLAGQDPELEDVKPTSIASYLLEFSGLSWWYGKLKTHGRLALGRTQRYRFLTDASARRVVRSVRLQLAVYAGGIALSAALGYPYFWLDRKSVV